MRLFVITPNNQRFAIRYMDDHYFDLGYTVVYKVKTHVIEFRAYKLLDAEAMTYQSATSDFSPDPVNDVSHAEWFVDGYIKPDGCINWKWNTDEFHWHTCAGNDNVKRMAELLVRIESAGAELFKSNVT